MKYVCIGRSGLLKFLIEILTIPNIHDWRCTIGLGLQCLDCGYEESHRFCNDGFPFLIDLIPAHCKPDNCGVRLFNRQCLIRDNSTDMAGAYLYKFCSKRNGFAGLLIPGGQPDLISYSLQQRILVIQDEQGQSSLGHWLGKTESMALPAML